MPDDLKDALFMLGELYFKHRRLQDENSFLATANARINEDIRGLLGASAAQQEEINRLREAVRIPEPDTDE